MDPNIKTNLGNHQIKHTLIYMLKMKYKRIKMNKIDNTP